MGTIQRVVGLGLGVMVAVGCSAATADQPTICKPGGTPNTKYHCETTTTPSTTTTVTTKATSTSTTRFVPPPPPAKTTTTTVAPPPDTTPGTAPPGEVPFTG